MFHSRKICQEQMRRTFLGFMAVLVLILSNSVAAAAEKNQPAKVEKPSGLATGARSLQEKETFRKKRPRGPIVVAIPLAYRYGTEAGNYYCSPSIRVTNSSNSPVEEIVIGIAYQQRPGRGVGQTITRLVDIDVHRQVTHFFYQLDTDNCFGVSGEVTVVRCVYADGEECASEVQATAFGTVPLKLATP